MKNEMITNARSYNKYLDKKEMESWNFNRLLANCHPLDREDFLKRFNRGEVL